MIKRNYSPIMGLKPTINGMKKRRVTHYRIVSVDNMHESRLTHIDGVNDSVKMVVNNLLNHGYVGIHDKGDIVLMYFAN